MIKTKRKNKKMEIDLTGPQGNAFFLLGVAQKLAKQMGKDEDSILKEMQSGNYENLVKVFDREFGSLVVLYR